MDTKNTCALNHDEMTKKPEYENGLKHDCLLSIKFKGHVQVFFFILDSRWAGPHMTDYQ